MKGICILLCILRFAIEIEIPFELRGLTTTKNNSITKEQQIASTLMTEYSINPITFPLCIGTPTVCYNMIYDTQSYYTYLCLGSCTMSPIQSYYNISQSKTIRKSEEHLIHISTKESEAFGYGYDSMDSIYIENKENYKISQYFGFMIMKDVYHPLLLGQADGVLGLNYEYSQIKYSFRHVLYLNKWIKNTVFAHKFITSVKGKVFFGETGLDKMTESKMKKCEMSMSSFNWECLILYIKINEDKIVINDNMLFSTGIYHIELPKNHAMNALMKYNSIIGSSHCNIIAEVKIIKLICDKLPTISSLPLLSFTFMNKLDFVISESDLFTYRLSDQRYEFCLVGNELITKGILGLVAMKKYHMVFDQNDRSIGAILNNEFEEIYQLSNNSFLILIILFVILIVLLMIMICICKRVSGFKEKDYITMEQIQDMTSLHNY